MELMRRPNITADDMKAIERLATTVGMVDIWLGGGGPGSQDAIQRVFYRGERTRPMPIMGTTERYVDINFAKMHAGRSFTAAGSAAHAPGGGGRLRRLRSVVREARHRSDRQAGSRRRVEYTVIGVMGKRPSPAGFAGADDFAIMPYTTFRKQFGSEKRQRGPFGIPGDDRGPARRMA